MIPQGFEIAGLIFSFVGSVWLVKALVRPPGGTKRGTLDVGDVAGLVTDMRGDAKWGSLGLVIGFFLQLVAALLRAF
jgi:hypothetical protein